VRRQRRRRLTIDVRRSRSQSPFLCIHRAAAAGVCARRISIPLPTDTLTPTLLLLLQLLQLLVPALSLEIVPLARTTSPSGHFVK